MDEGVESPAGTVKIRAEMSEHAPDREEVGRTSEPQHCSTATPRPVDRTRAQPRSDGILDGVPRELEEMGIGLHENRVEAALEQMAVLPVLPVEPLCVRAVEPLESGRERWAWRFDDKVEVVRH